MSSPGPSHSLRDIVGAVAEDVQGLVRGEMALARSELDQKIARVVMALVWLIGGMLLAFAGLVVILLAIAAALALVMPAWAASLITGIVVIVVGAIAARSGLAMVSLNELTPDRTVRNLQRDAHVVKEHT
jgi:uncharacterized membrane protein YqjE